MNTIGPRPTVGEMLQQPRSHLTILLSSLALLACISGIEILAATPAVARNRQARAQRIGSARTTDTHAEGDAHLEAALQYHGKMISDPAAQVSSGSDEIPVETCAFIQFQPSDGTALLLPAVSTHSIRFQRNPSRGRSPPVL